MTSDPRDTIAAVMRCCGARCTPDEFHSAINITFHNFEAEVYDRIHGAMWESLPRQFSLLVDDCLRQYPNAPSRMRVLDVGSGTGLASDCLVQSAFRPRITSIDLLDTSPLMLKQAVARSAKWHVPVRVRNSLISEIPDTDSYELIVTCSVLHHVPDLESFCKHVRRLQTPGGLFLHLQDPNAEFLEKKAPRNYSQIRRRVVQEIRRLTPKRAWGRIRRELAGTQGEDYISKTNRSLMESGIINAPLRAGDLFAITDIQFHMAGGISIDALRQWLPGYECLSQRSYAFFGKLWSELSPRMRVNETELSTTKASGGAEISAAWHLKAPAEPAPERLGGLSAQDVQPQFASLWKRESPSATNQSPESSLLPGPSRHHAKTTSQQSTD